MESVGEQNKGGNCCFLTGMSHAGEIMISGVTGEEFPAEIFIGPVYYQRLRHMVSDKFQASHLRHLNQTASCFLLLLLLFSILISQLASKITTE